MSHLTIYGLWHLLSYHLHDWLILVYNAQCTKQSGNLCDFTNILLYYFIYFIELGFSIFSPLCNKSVVNTNTWHHNSKVVCLQKVTINY